MQEVSGVNTSLLLHTELTKNSFLSSKIFRGFPVIGKVRGKTF